MSQSGIEQLLMPGTYLSYLGRVITDHVRLVAGTSLMPDQLQRPDALVPVRDVLTCVKNATALADRPHWHLSWARGMAEHFHGPVTLALVNAPTLGAGLDALVRFMPARVPYHHWCAGSIDGRHYCELQELMDFGPVRAILVEIPVLVMHEYVHTLRGGSMEGAEVHLRYPPTAYAGEYDRYFHCPVHFDSPRNALVVPEAWLQIPNAGHDAATWEMALRRCAQSSVTAREQDSLRLVRQAIYAQVDSSGGAPPTLREIAAQMHLSPRTLIRRLRQTGATYQGIVDEIQMDRARSLLARPGMRIADVASELGFSDPASFGRSFRRWFGMTPGVFRASLDASA